MAILEAIESLDFLNYKIDLIWLATQEFFCDYISTYYYFIVLDWEPSLLYPLSGVVVGGHPGRDLDGCGAVKVLPTGNGRGPLTVQF